MSRRIDAAFAKAKSEGRSLFIPFIMAGDPNREASQALLDALPQAGADIIELGMPFSDPMADGPVIQAAGLRALEAGASVKTTLAMVEAFRTQHAETPMILMGYYNPIYVYGPERFAQDAAKAGVDGLIIVDLPPEEEEELLPYLKQHNVALVRLLAPTSLGERLQKLTDTTTGYIYYISVTGVTGAKSADESILTEQVASIRRTTGLPIAVGFGVKTRAQVQSIGRFSDGVVVGSAIITEVAKYAASPKEELVAHVTAFIRGLSGRA